jgi:probable DNA metabolism protein
MATMPAASVPIVYDGSLEGLFSLLAISLDGGACHATAERICAQAARHAPEGDLFSASSGNREGGAADPVGPLEERSSAAAAERELGEASPVARMNFIYAWMSELPVERAALSFALRIIRAARRAYALGADGEGCRRAAEIARADRGDEAVRATLAAAQKVMREEHRLIGLLRFAEGADGRFIARCACDHAVLPALADHFSVRFGNRSWAIVDERRKIALIRDPPSPPRLARADEVAPSGETTADEWEELWRTYHQVIAIDSRTNPALQRRLMPVRYWKYLTELQ